MPKLCGPFAKSQPKAAEPGARPEPISKCGIWNPAFNPGPTAAATAAFTTTASSAAYPHTISGFRIPAGLTITPCSPGGDNVTLGRATGLHVAHSQGRGGSAHAQQPPRAGSLHQDNINPIYDPDFLCEVTGYTGPELLYQHHQQAFRAASASATVSGYNTTGQQSDNSITFSVGHHWYGAGSTGRGPVHAPEESPQGKAITTTKKARAKAKASTAITQAPATAGIQGGLYKYSTALQQAAQQVQGKEEARQKFSAANPYPRGYPIPVASFSKDYQQQQATIDNMPFPFGPLYLPPIGQQASAAAAAAVAPTPAAAAAAAAEAHRQQTQVHRANSILGRQFMFLSVLCAVGFVSSPVTAIISPQYSRMYSVCAGQNNFAYYKEYADYACYEGHNTVALGDPCHDCQDRLQENKIALIDLAEQLAHAEDRIAKALVQMQQAEDQDQLDELRRELRTYIKDQARQDKHERQLELARQDREEDLRQPSSSSGSRNSPPPLSLQEALAAISAKFKLRPEAEPFTPRATRPSPPSACSAASSPSAAPSRPSSSTSAPPASAPACAPPTQIPLCATAFVQLPMLHVRSTTTMPGLALGGFHMATGPSIPELLRSHQHPIPFDTLRTDPEARNLLPQQEPPPAQQTPDSGSSQESWIHLLQQIEDLLNEDD